MLETAVAPNPSQNQVDAVGQRSGVEIARAVFEGHRKGLMARRQRDLTCEKLLLHIDGSGDNQWADILRGQRVAIPRLLSEYRRSENLLRLIVDNAVAYHTTMPMRFLAESKADRESRERALIDTLWANHLAKEQDFNGLFAEALYMAMPAGFCPVHAYWREDTSSDWYEGVAYGQAGQEPQQPGMPPMPSRGFIDCFAGNPFDHVFNPGAKRGSIQSASYGRVLNADLVRRAFAHIPAARSLEGTRRIPSAAEYQRIVRDWSMTGLDTHGTSAIQGGRDADEELIAVICKEIAPNVLSDWPDGRLIIIGVNGTADTRKESARGNVVLLADQPLPGGDYSWSNVYSHHRFGDVHGKPWIEDMDQLQVDYNLAISKQWELIVRGADAPILASGEMVDDEMEFNGYTVLQLSGATFQPQQMETSAAVVNALQNFAEARKNGIFTMGGYQAASRGESNAGDAYRKVVALQQADDTIHGPVNIRFRRSATDFMGRCWRLMKAYGDVPWVVDAAGEEYAHLADTYVDNTKMSESPPSFTLVSGYGSSPELRGQELLDLVSATGADGVPLLRTEEFRKQYPHQNLFDDDNNPAAVQRRRAKVINGRLRWAAQQYRKSSGFDENAVPPEQKQMAVQQAGMMVYQQMAMEYPQMRSDDLEAHLGALTEIVQDETEDPIARFAAELRMEDYYQWQMMQAMQSMPAPVDAEGNPVQQQPQAGGGAAPEQVAQQGPFGSMPQDAMSPQAIGAQMHGYGPQAGVA